MCIENISDEDLILMLDNEYNLDISFKNEKVSLPDEINKKIKENWDENGGRFKNGEIFYIRQYTIDKEEKNIKLDICNSYYDHYLYTRLKKEYDEYSCVNLWAGALIETNDNKFVLGRMSNETVCEGELHISGGSTDRADIFENKINYKQTMIRELYEEIGIDADDKNIVKEYKVNYLKLPNKKEVELSFGILFKVKLNIDFNLLEERFKTYKKYLQDNKLEVEFTDLYGIDKNKESIEMAIEKYGNKIPAYTIELFLKEISI